MIHPVLDEEGSPYVDLLCSVWSLILSSETTEVSAGHGKPQEPGIVNIYG